MSAQPYTHDDLKRGEEVVKTLHGITGFDRWAEHIAKEIARARSEPQNAQETESTDHIDWDIMAEERLEQRPRSASPPEAGSIAWRTDFENAPSPCLGWCQPPSGDEVRQIWRSADKKSWTAHSITQSVKAWQPMPSLATPLPRLSDKPPAFYGAQCPFYPACTGGCGLGCTQEIETARAARLSDECVDALAPFAKVAESDIGQDETDADIFQPMRSGYNRAPLITVGDMRRAAAALRRTLRLSA